MKKEGTRRCLHQDTKSLITPSLHLCFALTCCLFVCLFVCYECIRQSKQHNILTSNCLRNMLCCGLGRKKDVGMGAGPLKGATPRRVVWRRSRPLLLAGTSATAAPDLAVVLNGVLSLFVGEAQG